MKRRVLSFILNIGALGMMHILYIRMKEYEQKQSEARQEEEQIKIIAGKKKQILAEEEHAARRKGCGN